ncbi:MAG: hypothetical protein KDD62_06260 [Bdellovibrionales bacterium]|nr:hypothetical protein [Bdellovibrionales bacterium]
MKQTLKILATMGFLSLGLSACMSHESVEEIVLERSYVVPDPGAVEYVWEPPLIDVVDVPPGLDPEGHYYRPAHQEVVEIRQGRWKYYKEKK